jgi:hypothetical protein
VAHHAFVQRLMRYMFGVISTMLGFALAVVFLLH